MKNESNSENLNPLRDNFVVDAAFISLKPMVSGQLSLIFRSDPVTTDKISHYMNFYQSRGQLKFSAMPIEKTVDDTLFREAEIKEQIREMGTKSIRQRLDAAIFKKWQETDKKQTSEEFARDIYVELIEAIREL